MESIPPMVDIEAEDVKPYRSIRASRCRKTAIGGWKEMNPSLVIHNLSCGRIGFWRNLVQYPVGLRYSAICPICKL